MNLRNLKKMALKHLPEFIRHKKIRSQLKLGRGAASHIVIKLAETQEELEQAFKVLHDAYVDEGWMDSQISGLRMTKFHSLPMTAVLIAKDMTQNQVVGTISVIRNSPLGLPLDSVYSLHSVKAKYSNLAEISSLAIRKDYRTAPAQLFWPLIRSVIRYSRDVMHVDAYVIGVHPTRHDLYTAVLGFNPMKETSTKDYGFVKNAPVKAYIADVKQQEAWYQKKFSHLPNNCNWYKYCIQDELPAEQYQFSSPRYFAVQRPVMNESLFSYFFQEKTDTAATLHELEKKHVEIQLSLKKSFLINPSNNVIPFRKVRKETRFNTGIQCEILLENENGLALAGKVINFSARGVAIQTESALPETMTLKVFLGPNDVSLLKVQVATKNHQIYGAKIISQDEKWNEFILSMNSPLVTNGLQKTA